MQLINNIDFGFITHKLPLLKSGLVLSKTLDKLINLYVKQHRLKINGIYHMDELMKHIFGSFPSISIPQVNQDRIVYIPNNDGLSTIQAIQMILPDFNPDMFNPKYQSMWIIPLLARLNQQPIDNVNPNVLDELYKEFLLLRSM